MKDDIYLDKSLDYSCNGLLNFSYFTPKINVNFINYNICAEEIRNLNFSQFSNFQNNLEKCENSKLDKLKCSNKLERDSDEEYHILKYREYLNSHKTLPVSIRSNDNDFQGKFFVVKSINEENIYKSIRYGVWSSTSTGNQKLNKAFLESKLNYPIFLLFSVNGSGRFLGVALMISEIDNSKDFTKWSEASKWHGFFKVKWIILKDVPNKILKKIKNPLNEFKSVVVSRDTQEIESCAGSIMLKTISNYKSKTSILDDFEFYRQIECLNKKNNFSKID